MRQVDMIVEGIMPGDILGFTASLALGLTFLLSGFSKLRDLSGFIEGVLEYQILPHQLATFYGKMLPIVELASGAALLLGIWPRGMGLFSIVLLSSFLAAVTINIARGRQLDCHCFVSQKGERLGRMTVVRLLILLSFAVITVFNRDNEPFAAIPAGLAPLNLLLTFLLALGMFVGIYLLGFFPTVWDILQIKANPTITAHQAHVSLKGAPLSHHNKTEV